MTDPVKEAVERLEARLNARLFDVQPSSDIRRILASHSRLEAENARLVKLVEEAGEALDLIERKITAHLEDARLRASLPHKTIKDAQ